MKIIWEVKCYRCSRVCGILIEAPKAYALLTDSSKVHKAPLCSFTEGRGPHCSRCGGQLYTEEAEGIYYYETLQARNSLN